MLKNLFFFIAVFFVSTCCTQQATWSPPFDLTQAGFFAQNPEIKVNANGTIIAVWSRDNGTNKEIQESHSTDGGYTWTNPQRLSDVIAGEDAENPSLAINDNDVAVVIWEKLVGADIRIQRSFSLNGGVSWSTPVEISPPTGDADSSKLAFNNNGKAVAVWRWDNGTNYETDVAYSLDNGDNWSATLLSTTGVTTFDPNVSLNDNDEAIAIWRETVAGFYLVRRKYSQDAGASWSTVSNVSAPGAHAYEPEIDMNENGAAIFVWRMANGEIATRDTPDGGITLNPIQQISSVTGTTYFANVTINNSNHAVALWLRDIGGNNVAETSYSTDGGTNWSTPSALTTLNGTVNKYPKIVINNNDIVIPFYALKENTSFITQSSLSYDGGINWNPPSIISDNTGSAQENEITANDNNLIIGIWERDGIIQVSYLTTTSISTNQIHGRSLFQNQLVNELIWEAIPNAAFYRVYSNANLTNLLYEGTDPFYYDGTIKGQSKTYYIVYVDNNGNQSTPMIVTIP